MKKENKYLILGILIGAIIVYFLYNQSYSQFRLNTNMPMMGNTQKNSNAIDAHFIEEMIPHHQGAIDMSNLALKKSTHPELKQLAQNIIKDQSAEIQKMTSWYKKWFGKDLPVNKEEDFEVKSGMGHMNMMMHDSSDISDLENSENFDLDFIKEMIPHHQMAIMMANMLKNSTNRQEMLDLSNSIIKSQDKEIQQMKKWYNEWK